MERRKFIREFKLEAVRLIKERGVSYAQASHDLGVHQSQLRSWVKALADDPQHAFPGSLTRPNRRPESAALTRKKIQTETLPDRNTACPSAAGNQMMIGEWIEKLTARTTRSQWTASPDRTATNGRRL
jgi:transposase